MRPRNPSLVWFDGRFVKKDRATVPITTHAIHYGTSVFEGIRAYWNSKNLNIFRLDDHVRRFRRSGKYYSMSLRFSDAQIRDAIIGLCRRNGMKKSCYIRPFYFIGQHGISLHVTGRAPTHMAIFLFPLGRIFKRGGISAGVSPWRKFPDASTPVQAKMGGNYLNSIIATQEARRNGHDEAILLDVRGSVAEAPGENIFVIRDGELVTPPASVALAGITRDTILKCAAGLGYTARVRRITRRQLCDSDEVLLCGTAAEITPIIKIDGHRIGNGKVGRITGELIAKYEEIVMGRDPEYSGWLTGVYR